MSRLLYVQLFPVYNGDLKRTSCGKLDLFECVVIFRSKTSVNKEKSWCQTTIGYVNLSFSNKES